MSETSQDQQLIKEIAFKINEECKSLHTIIRNPELVALIILDITHTAITAYKRGRDD